MTEQTKIQWCDHAFNPWRGPQGTRVVAAEAQWEAVERWNREAAGAERRPRVFAGNLMDVFENWPRPIANAKGQELDVCRNGHWCAGTPEPSYCPECGDAGAPLEMDHVRRRLFGLIDSCPNLDFLLLTKQPENILRMWPAVEQRVEMRNAAGRLENCSRHHRRNVWLITSVEDQATADERIPELLKCRDLAPVLGVSAEPLLGPINITRLRDDGRFASPGVDALDWVIAGGESGSHARPCNVDWIRSIRDQCQAAGVACFVKQLGARPLAHVSGGDGLEWPRETMLADVPLLDDELATFALRHPKGGDPAEWPEDLRVRQFPQENP